MIEYKTKKTAQAAFNREKAMMADMKCPVFKTFCYTEKCVSFGGRICKISMYNKSPIFKMYKPYCMNAIVTGTIEMEGP